MRLRRPGYPAATVLTVMVSAVLSVVAPAAADPPGGATAVVLGDSFTATAPVLGHAEDGCTHSVTSWPNQLAREARLAGGSQFVDVSCNGGTLDTGDGWTLVHQARKAFAQGAFGADTRAVLIQVGLNDRWGASTGTAFPSTDCLLNVVAGCGFEATDQHRLPDYRAVSGAGYADRVRDVVTFVRYHAAGARVALVGYPEVFASDQSSACMDLAGIGRVVQPRAEGYIAYLDKIQQAQREAAALLGIEFLDVRAITAGHGSCTAEPWISGLDGASSLFDGAPIHPNAQGNGAVAAQIRERFGL
ncbi:SGNH/GDSL hydrolase family protein [Nocardia sp. NPDC058658]|uniref:SGNH/GDSL hydrolase family protein n=1 Tax=Nocardia sp. NPDC058658 TaxID=3346580 RepID=UPI003667059C